MSEQELNSLTEQPDSIEISENTKRITVEERIKLFEDVLNQDIIDISKLREYCWRGVPEKSGLRQLCWKILLGLLNDKPKIWDSILAEKRELFASFVTEFVINPREKNKNVGKDNVIDHPLSLDDGSTWNEYFKDNELLFEIDKDIKRTFPTLNFFHGEKSTHTESLKRILFIWCKLNPGISYVQGMNEILGPIYYIFATDPSEENRNNAEADSFFCFTNLMSEIMNNFIKTLDKSNVGIVHQIHQLSALLNKKDPELWENLESKGLNPQFYSFRWLTLLLSQEFELPEILRLWDTLFSDENRFQFLKYVACSMLISIRDTLLKKDFGECLKILQRYPPCDLEKVLRLAEELRENKSFNVYNMSQL